MLGAFPLSSLAQACPHLAMDMARQRDDAAEAASRVTTVATAEGVGEVAAPHAEEQKAAEPAVAAPPAEEQKAAEPAAAAPPAEDQKAAEPAVAAPPAADGDVISVGGVCSHCPRCCPSPAPSEKWRAASMRG